MVSIKRPMLATAITNLNAIRFPVLLSPKYDGIRALTKHGMLVSRNLKPIPNDYIKHMARGLPDNLDGELIQIGLDGNLCEFNDCSSAIMSQDGEPNVKYFVFDYVKTSLDTPAEDRIKDLIALKLEETHPDFVTIVRQHEATTIEEVLDYEELCLEVGYEGVMLRAPRSPYKEGRSTEIEGYLLKQKRFVDSEAEIVGFEERQHNSNAKTTDLLGYTKRSQAKAGMIPDGTLGKLYVKDINSGVEFEIGTGFDDTMRQKIWDNKGAYLHKIVKYKYQAKGVKDKPRFPVFLGFRYEGDMDDTQ